MSSILTKLVLAVLTAQAASSALHTSPPSASATCTIPVFRKPSFQTDCIFYKETTTSTSYTDCKGCEIQTKAFGLGLPCETVTTTPGVATETALVCKKQRRHRHTVTVTVTVTVGGY